MTTYAVLYEEILTDQTIVEYFKLRKAAINRYERIKIFTALYREVKLLKKIVVKKKLKIRGMYK